MAGARKRDVRLVSDDPLGLVRGVGVEATDRI
jgi:hypothetical protein